MENKHVESAVKIHYTQEYGKFKNLLGNRNLSERKIKRIVKDIENGLDMLKYCPIIIDADWNIIDGQHRFWVSKHLKKNVYYVISNGLSLIDIAKINSNTDKWKTVDFLNCYIAQRNENYIKLEAFAKRYPLPMGTAVKLLMDGTVNDGSGKTALLRYERGEFLYVYDDYATELMELCGEFNFSKNYCRPFIAAVHNLLKAGKCDPQMLLVKYRSMPDAMDRCITTKEYMIALESVYNLHAKVRKIIF